MLDMSHGVYRKLVWFDLAVDREEEGLRQSLHARLFEGQASGASLIVQRIKYDANLWIADGACRLGRLFCE